MTRKNASPRLVNSSGEKNSEEVTADITQDAKPDKNRRFIKNSPRLSKRKRRKISLLKRKINF